MQQQLTWPALLGVQQEQDYFKQLMTQLEQQKAQGNTVFPPEQDIFNAFKHTAFSDVKVVILGQDPYHGAGQAHGLAFSVNKGVKIPPSLINIYKELATDITGFEAPAHGNLLDWAKQGVLLLNTVLTVQQSNAHSHAKLGWQQFSEAIIGQINQHNSGCVFILWGAHARKKAKFINLDKHLVLEGPHPSPLSVYRGFYGCQHFSKANAWLNGQGKQGIDWRLA
jgi:uracil-DNA glycosylase